ncbi:hypothetical protein [Nostoc sp. WHI]|uniref:hypothetical protein n=1 Tax=Nostoc sp. WHI TaxID=2650611 RepID=UPI0018C6A91F|nr:hypothetical protein [Nostoc sp. WHI]
MRNETQHFRDFVEFYFSTRRTRERSTQPTIFLSEPYWVIAIACMLLVTSAEMLNLRLFCGIPAFN